MASRSKSIMIRADPKRVFAYMDEIGNTGMHMTKSSMPMMGSSLHLQQLTEHTTGLGSKSRWYGKVLGFTMDFTVVVTKWIEGKEKIWETVGNVRMIILSWYRMRLVLSPVGPYTNAELDIEYEMPRNIFFRILAFILTPWYASWCIGSMLRDSKTALEQTKTKHSVEA